MKKIVTLFLIISACVILVAKNAKAQSTSTTPEETIFVWGGDIKLKFAQYVIELTKKENPRICFLPTASADNQDNIKVWESFCKTLGIEPIVFKVWVSSSEKNQSFEEILLNSDAIVVGGGNTLNMLGIWNAQGIDRILRMALKKGIILAGGSAGSICWFQNGISDSRPMHLSIVDGLNILPYSTCPHYSEDARRGLYHQMIKDKKMGAGYGSDEKAGILFKNGKAVDFVTLSDHNSYFVSLNNEEVNSTKMDSRILLNKEALLENAYIVRSVKKKISDLLDVDDRMNPLNAYVHEKTKTIRLNKDGISQLEISKVKNISIEKIFIYNDELVGVVNDAYLDSFGYAIWYFYKHDGTWTSMGEDIGGTNLLESEITFREKAKIIIKQAEERFNF